MEKDRLAKANTKSQSQNSEYEKVWG